MAGALGAAAVVAAWQWTGTGSPPPASSHSYEGSKLGDAAPEFRLTDQNGKSVAHVHLRYLNPLPADLGDILARFKRVLVPELNLGQLSRVLRADYLVDTIGFNKIQGQPFKVSELVAKMSRIIEEAQ